MNDRDPATKPHFHNLILVIRCNQLDRASRGTVDCHPKAPFRTTTIFTSGPNESKKQESRFVVVLWVFYVMTLHMSSSCQRLPDHYAFNMFVANTATLWPQISCAGLHGNEFIFLKVSWQVLRVITPFASHLRLRCVIVVMDMHSDPDCLTIAGPFLTSKMKSLAPICYLFVGRTSICNSRTDGIQLETLSHKEQNYQIWS